VDGPATRRPRVLTRRLTRASHVLKTGGRGVRNGGVSFWFADTSVPQYRSPLRGDTDADVCIVGAGLTGLWTAYYLARAEPALRIVVLEREFAGFGASGRNGGWLSADLSASRQHYAATHGRASVVDLLGAMRAAVDEVIAVARAERIEADVVKGGLLRVARTRAQLSRLRAAVEREHDWGARPEDLRWLSAGELEGRVVVAGALGAIFSPHGARVQPAKLVRGLAAAVERLGVVICEQTTVREIGPRVARSDHGTVRAPFVLRCLEGFTASIKGARRNWLPMNSSMIVTDPLPDADWDQIGWNGAELLGDFAHAYMYAQRTADGRIALGGRGVPYRYGSRTDQRGVTQHRTIHGLTRLLHDMFPGIGHVPIAHAWCGVLGVPRDWCATVSLDRATGIGFAGGYVGKGLTASNLAGRTLADLVLGMDSTLTRLPWVDRQVRRWEPEPIRWLGVQAMYLLYRAADRRETERELAATSQLARLANLLTGR
jgi:glycine/D-amino acid oxidase-like deaminating enzyme